MVLDLQGLVPFVVAAPSLIVLALRMAVVVLDMACVISLVAEVAVCMGYIFVTAAVQHNLVSYFQMACPLMQLDHKLGDHVT